ncbi:transposase [Streptomyces sp. 8N616]|uniref:transposase n=1 Tax=Streptomyces sp. 8N616 TaxID=3457414 RepID=UPI003FD201A1
MPAAATCPNGVTSGSWKHGKSRQGLPVIRIAFRKSDYEACPALRECVSSATGVRRELTVRHREDHEAVRRERTRQQTHEWKERYMIRAGIEGTVSQAVHSHGLRRSRYRGFPKTSLQASSPAPRSTSPASMPGSPTLPEPAPEPAASKHFAPPEGRRGEATGPQSTNNIAQYRRAHPCDLCRRRLR